MTRVRIGTDIVMRARLLDSGVAYDWSTPPAAVRLLNETHNAVIRRLEYERDKDDGTVLVVRWDASGQSLLGAYRLIVSAELDGRTATFDAPAFELVRLLDETQEGAQPDEGISDIGITLSVESIDTSLISQILEDCRVATEEALDAAARAEKTDNAVQAAEEKRVSAEETRVSAEEDRKKAEQARATAEQSRVSAEQGRVSAEQDRVKAEQVRASSETDRVSAEQKRAAAEQSREKAEQERVAAEEGRMKAEQGRVTAEAERAEAFSGMMTEAKAATSSAEAAAKTATDTAVEAYKAAVGADEAAENAQESAALAQENVLALEIDSVTGRLEAVVGADRTAFASGQITEKGEVVLEFNYE